MGSTEAETLVERLRKVADASLDALKSPTSLSYLGTYQVFLGFFQSEERIDRNTVLLGASLAYSWMPTVLTLNLDGLDQSAAILDEVRRGREPSAEDLEQLKKTINNSLVGASKLLHFIAPERFPIWDSRTCSFLGWPPSSISKVATYQRYQTLCLATAKLTAFADIHARLEGKLGSISRLRSVELLMYLGGAPARQ